MAEQRSSNKGFGTTILVAFFLCGALFLAYKYLSNRSPSSNFTFIPKEVQVNYVPSEFDYKIDDEYTLVTLNNPKRYRREFDQFVYDFNLQMLQHVARRMSLPDSLFAQVETEYQKHHGYLKDLYFEDYIKLKDTSAELYETWYESNGSNAVDAIKEVAGKYTCFLTNHVLATLVNTTDGKFYAKGRGVDDPCLIATTEALRPMLNRLTERAAIDDFSRSKGLLEEKIEKTIAELATMEVRDKKGLNKTLQTKVLGYSVSSTDIEVSAISILKVGFKLDKYFDIDISSKKKRVVITLPNPQILSHEVYPKVDKLDVGWMREISNEEFNENFNLLRSEFRREALESNLYDKSKQQARELMDLILNPMVQGLRSGYKLEVRFKEIEENNFSRENPNVEAISG